MDLTSLIESKQDAKVAELLRTGTFPSRGKKKTGAVPLMAAMRAESFAVADMLLEAGADPNETEDEGCSPLFEAVKLSSAHPKEGAALVRKLVARGAKLDAIVFERSSVLGIAAENGNLELVRLLLELGASVQPKGAAEPPLSLAFSDGPGAEAIALLLLERGANPNDGDPLRSALIFGWDRVAEALLTLGADPKQGEPLDAAAFSGSLPWVKRLLALGADPAAGSPIYEAFKNGHAEVLALLLEATPEFDHDTFRRSGMARAEGEIAELFLARMTWDDARLPDLLVSCILEGGVTMGKYALERTSDLGRAGTLGLAPIHAAVLARSAAWLGILLEKGADASVALAKPTKYWGLELPKGATAYDIAVRVHKGQKKEGKDTTAIAAIEATLSKLRGKPSKREKGDRARPAKRPSGPLWRAEIDAALEKVAKAGANDVEALREGLAAIEIGKLEPWGYLVAACSKCGHGLFSDKAEKKLKGTLLLRVLQDRLFEGTDWDDAYLEHYPKEARAGLKAGSMIACADADIHFLWPKKGAGPESARVCHAHPEGFRVVAESVVALVEQETSEL